MEHVSLGDTVRFGITLSNPGLSGQLSNADETPRWYVYTSTSGDNRLMQGNFGARANLIGTYSGVFVASSANNFVTGDYVEVHASGKVCNVVGRQIIKTFVIDDIFRANIVQINGSGVEDGIIDANVVQVSGLYVGPTDVIDANVVRVSGIPVGLADDSYFANIKFIKDSVVPRDEYTVQWFRNAVPLSSGATTNHAISVYKADGTNTALFTNQKLGYTNVNHGGLRYNEATNLQQSGEAYMVITSGTIDSYTRVWQNIVGLDYL